ncbi:MAG: DUF2069 domain-containing protein [Formosimonas sp.]
MAAIAAMALVILCAVWESVGAPLRDGGTFFALKGFLLVPLLPAIWRGERSKFLTLSLLTLLYLLEGMTRAYADINPVSRWFAGGEIVLGLAVFISSNAYIKNTRSHSKPPRIRPMRSRLIFWIVALVCLQLLMPSVWQAQANNETAYLLVRLGLALLTFVLLLTYLFRLYQISRMKS